MADAPPKGKGGGLGKKVGPLPLWAWVIGGVLLLYVAYRFMTGSSGSSGSAVQTQTTQASTPSDATGLVPTAGSAGDTGQTTSDLVSALGGQQQSLLDALEAKNQDVLALAQSQINAAQGNPQVSPSSTTETLPMTGQQPGGSNSPIYVYVSPSATSPNSSTPNTTNAPKTSTPPAPSRYYTYKSDALKAAKGVQTNVHFKTGYGYYVV